MDRAKTPNDDKLVQNMEARVAQSPLEEEADAVPKPMKTDDGYEQLYRCSWCGNASAVLKKCKLFRFHRSRGCTTCSDSSLPAFRRAMYADEVSRRLPVFLRSDLNPVCSGIATAYARRSIGPTIERPASKHPRVQGLPAVESRVPECCVPHTVTH